jgi:hypothetical protein
MQELVEQRPFQHLGLYRSVVGEKGVSRPLTLREARLDAFTLRTLYRRDHSQGCKQGMPEGALSNYIGKRMTDETWTACIKRLQEWKMIEFIPSYRGDGLYVRLTEPGKFWAIELCCARQRSGKSPDGVEDLVEQETA